MKLAHVAVVRNINNVAVNKPLKPRKYKGFGGLVLSM